MNHAINSVIETLANSEINKNKSKYPYFTDKRYTSHILDINNFNEIQSHTHNHTIAAVDGGNIEIISAPNFSLSLIRVAANTYKNNKKIKLPFDNIMTFLCLTTSAIDQNKNIIYTTNLFPLNQKHEEFSKKIKTFEFNSFDPTISSNQKKADLTTMGSVTRCFLEWLLLEKLTDTLTNNDIIIKDGSLQTRIIGENKYSDPLFTKAMKKNIIVCGLSKTTTLLTDTAASLAEEITNLSKNTNHKTWVYHPVCDIEHQNHKAEMYFVKLNENSKHTFRFEILKNQKQYANTTINAIAKNSNDISFPGYPYALIDVDRLARVRYNEIEHYRVLFMASAAKNPIRNKILTSVSSINAHGILDRMIK
ncbi:hypothetical protein GQ473_02790 [archaeon]|nr:hypothetical protein [archaeon]